MKSQSLLDSSTKAFTPASGRRLYLAPLLALGMILMAFNVIRAQDMPPPPAFPSSLELMYGAGYGFSDGQGPVTLTGDGSGHYTGTYLGPVTYGYPTIDYEDLGGYQWEDVGYWDYNNISGYDEDGNPIPTWVSDWEWVWVSDWEWVSGSATATADFTFYVYVSLDESGQMYYTAFAYGPYETYYYNASPTLDVSSGSFDFSSLSGWISPE